MAIRPVVLVYETFATQTVTPPTPDLNSLIVGPAYYIQDYFAPGTTNYADKTNIVTATAYGALEASPASPTPTGPAVITIAEPPNNLVGALLDDASVQIYFDQARVRIANGTAGTTTASSNTFSTSETPTATTFNTPGPGQVFAGDRIVIVDGSSHVIARTVLAVVSDTALTFTADVTTPFIAAASQTWYIERQLNDQLVSSSFITTNNNSVSIAGSVTLPVPGQGNKTVSYAVVYEAYRSLRQDLVELDTVSTEADILSKIGRLDARNPLGAGVFVALQNTTSVIQFVGVLSDDLPGYTTVRDNISARPDVYAITPLNTSTSILAMWNTDCVGLALPDNVQGRPQRFRVVIGNGTLPITETIIQPSATGQSTQLAGSGTGAITQITLPAFAIPNTVLPGYTLVLTLDAAGVSRNGTYTIATNESATVLEVDTSAPFPSAETGNLTAQIFMADGVTSVHGPTAITAAITAAQDDFYLVLKDPSGTFVASGVAAGDQIQIPVDPNAAITPTSVFVTLIVNNVISDQRLQIVNNGQDSSTVQNELPHGVKRIGGALVGLTAVNYQVVRTLSKDQQVTNLIAVAQSFNSSRTILVWPDKCDVAGITGGTKQPGWYLGCAVGGMTAGLPSQQGFTNIGIAGVSQIYDSNTYFTDTQISDLSNGGWYVFAQQTPASLPYTIHQLTTNPTTLESGEFSVVKNFDFVSLFFVDIVEDFLGQYNVTTDTLTLLGAALNTGAQLLLLRTVAKIGAPLTSFALTGLDVSPTSGDRVLVYCAIGLPKPLNVIELHLVA